MITCVREISPVLRGTAWVPASGKWEPSRRPIVIFPEAFGAPRQTRPRSRIPAVKVEQENVPADAQPAAYLSKDLRTPLPVTGSADLLCGSQTRRSAAITRC